MKAMQDNADNPTIVQQLCDRIVASYLADERTQRLDAVFLPNRARTIETLELMRRLIFPGFFDQQRLSTESIDSHVHELVNRVRQLLYDQVRQTLRYELNRAGGDGSRCKDCDQKAERITMAMLECVPEIRRKLGRDVQAAFDGDPAAISTNETIFCYPGIDAIFTHRVAHELSILGVPLLARIMSEYAHNETGIDIHPGACIGDSFFIDHGTGVVIGETTVIGRGVKIYQGVTLGALSTRGGQLWRGRKRHPTIEDDVTLYGGAIILGGETVIGRGSEIGGTVFLTTSVPPYHKVSIKRTGWEIKSMRRPKTAKPNHDESPAS